MKKTLRYNFRLNPAPCQEAKLIEFGAYARGLWNLLLSENIRRYQYDKTFLFYREMADLITQLKAFEEFAWLKAFDSAAAQQVARDLDLALRNACSKERLQRFPKHKITFRQKKLHDDSFRVVNNANCIRIEDGCISIPKVGKVPIVLHRKLVSQIKTATLQYRHGKWQISIVQEVDCAPRKDLLTSVTGYDINSHFSVVGSNGWYVTNARALKQSMEKLNHLQRQMARRKKGSKRWIKTRNRINKLHGKISRQRLALAHEVTNSIANSSDIVIFENLNVKAMQRFNGSMVADNVMGMITQMARYKVELNGGLYHEIGRFVKSTGICQACGHHHTLSLSVRTFTCTHCAMRQCRDLSAAACVALSGEKELIAAGTVVRVAPNAQQKASGQTKVFGRVLKFGAGSEQKEAA
ncbi:MAG: transposase [Pseudohongiella sp.]|nr:transposase [Pseudohongiella sp.]